MLDKQEQACPVGVLRRSVYREWSMELGIEKSVSSDPGRGPVMQGVGYCNKFGFCSDGIKAVAIHGENLNGRVIRFKMVGELTVEAGVELLSE